MSEARVIAAVLGSEWAMAPDALLSLVAIARRENESPEAVEARLGRPLENTHRAETRGSVAVIPVVGPLFRRANLFTRVSGATSYDVIAQDLQAALDNPAVRSIVLNIDSPGGTASGVAELASHIVDARAKKTVVAYVGGMGASAAYWLASAASEIVANKTALLGSVGVVVSIEKKRDGEDSIVSSQSPYKRIDPATAEGRARIQATVDALASIFVEDVAKHRGLSTEQVLANFGQGDVMLGAAAEKARMVDSLGTFEALIDRLNGQPTSERFGMATAIATVEQLRAEYPALVEQIRSEAKAGAAAEAKAIAEMASADVEKAKTEAAAAERTRVIGIIGHVEAKGREALALKLAGMPSMSIDGAAEIMSATPKVESAAGSVFDAVMSKINPDVKPDAAKSDEDGDDATVARIAAMANEQKPRL